MNNNLAQMAQQVANVAFAVPPPPPPPLLERQRAILPPNLGDENHEDNPEWLNFIAGLPPVVPVEEERDEESDEESESDEEIILPPRRFERND